MARRKFKLSHSLWGTAALLVVEGAGLYVLHASVAGTLVLLFCAALGVVANIYISTEIIEEVRGTPYMLVLLSAVMFELLVFFAFQYWFLLLLQPASFPTLGRDPVSLLLHSTMVFVFNPLYLPATGAGRALLLLNTLGALGLVLFILQNIWQFRRAVS